MLVKKFENHLSVHVWVKEISVANIDEELLKYVLVNSKQYYIFSLFWDKKKKTLLNNDVFFFFWGSRIQYYILCACALFFGTIAVNLYTHQTKPDDNLQMLLELEDEI